MTFFAFKWSKKPRMDFLRPYQRLSYQEENTMADITKEDVVKFIENMTVLEMSEFVKEL